jgi:hypothetical protein
MTTQLVKKYLLRAFICLNVFTLMCSSKNACHAQSVVGKWHRDLTKIFTTDKATGKPVPVSDEMQKQYNDAVTKNGYNESLELNSNNTYISTVSAGGSEPKIHKGNYSLSGNILDLNIPLVQGQKTTITLRSLTDKEMVWDLLFMGKLTEIFYTRI